MIDSIRKTVQKISRTDWLAAAVCLVLFSLYLVSIHRGLGIDDESFYYTIPQRLAQGDRLLITSETSHTPINLKQIKAVISHVFDVNKQ